MQNMMNLTAYYSIICIIFTSKFTGWFSAHKKNIYEGADFIHQAPRGAIYPID